MELVKSFLRTCLVPDSSTSGGNSGKPRAQITSKFGPQKGSGQRKCDGAYFRCGRKGHFKRDCKAKGFVCLIEAGTAEGPCGSNSYGGVCQCACQQHLHFGDFGDEIDPDPLNGLGD